MEDEQKQLIREKFEKWRLEWKGGATNHYASDKEIADFWLNELDLAIKQTEERIVEKLQEKFKQKYRGFPLESDEVGYNQGIKESINLIRNK